MKPQPVGQITLDGVTLVFMATPVSPGDIMINPDERESYYNWYNVGMRPLRKRKREYLRKLVNRRLLSFTK